MRPIEHAEIKNTRVSEIFRVAGSTQDAGTGHEPAADNVRGLFGFLDQVAERSDAAELGFPLYSLIATSSLVNKVIDLIKVPL
jgi:hypothetical protein